MRAESEKEKEQKVKKWEKRDDPSPTTYKASESFINTQTEKVRAVKIIKEAKIVKFYGEYITNLKLYRCCYQSEKVCSCCRYLQHR